MTVRHVTSLAIGKSSSNLQVSSLSQVRVWEVANSSPSPVVPDLSESDASRLKSGLDLKSPVHIRCQVQTCYGLGFQLFAIRPLDQCTENNKSIIYLFEFRRHMNFR
jgi:hypothetical protein